MLKIFEKENIKVKPFKKETPWLHDLLDECKWGKRLKEKKKKIQVSNYKTLERFKKEIKIDVHKKLAHKFSKQLYLQ